MNRQYFTAFATAAILLAVSAFAFSATDFGAANESTAAVADLDLGPTPVAAIAPAQGVIDLNDWQPTDFREDLINYFTVYFGLYRNYPIQSFIFFRLIIGRTPF